MAVLTKERKAMKRLLGALVVTSLVEASALAADMVPSSPLLAWQISLPPAPLAWWSGVYIGVNAGHTWGADPVDTEGAQGYANKLSPAYAGALASALSQLGTTKFPVSNGFIGGIQVGYNYQFAGLLVAGIEADIQSASVSSSANQAVVTQVSGFAENYTSAGSMTDKLGYLGTFRARLGVTVTPTLLAYATAGSAYGGVSTSTSFTAAESRGGAVYPPVSASSSISGTRTGWTAGGGIEWMFARNWSAKGEYLYYDLGSATSDLNLAQINLAAAGHPLWGAASVISTTRFSGEIVRVGLNYNWGR
jgi:outer membrane immunogenic protein